MKAMTLMVVLAVAAAGLTGCATMTPTQGGALTGATIGAGTGALIGGASRGRAGEGALVGAAVGGLSGALVGDAIDESRTTRVQNEVVVHEPERVRRVQTERVETGRYETRIVRTPSGETYEERVWVPDR